MEDIAAIPTTLARRTRPLQNLAARGAPPSAELAEILGIVRTLQGLEERQRGELHGLREEILAALRAAPITEALHQQQRMLAGLLAQQDSASRALQELSRQVAAATADTEKRLLEKMEDGLGPQQQKAQGPAELSLGSAEFLRRSREDVLGVTREEHEALRRSIDQKMHQQTCDILQALERGPGRRLPHQSPRQPRSSTKDGPDGALALRPTMASTVPDLGTPRSGGEAREDSKSMPVYCSRSAPFRASKDSTSTEHGCPSKSIAANKLGFVQKIDVSHETKAACASRHLRKSVSGSESGKKRTVVEGVACLLEWWDKLREPERSGTFHALLNSKMFEIICVLVIVTNGLFVGYSSNLEMSKLIVDVRPGASEISVDSAPEGMDSFVTRAEFVFVGWYSLEFLLKFVVHRFYIFLNEERRWNIFDLVLLLFSLFDLIVTSVDTNMTFMRMLRILKVVKVLRTLRAMRYFDELRVMMDCVMGSFMQLIWCLAVIVFIMYLFAVLFMQGMTEFMADWITEVNANDVWDDHNVDQYNQIMHSFSSIQSTILMLWQSVTGGIDWALPYELIAKSGWIRAVGFLFFIVFFAVAVWNIITSTFVEKVLKLAQPDIDTLMLDKRRKDMADAKQLKILFSRLDMDSSASISNDEFEKCMQNPDIEAFMNARGIDIKDAKIFFTMLTESTDADSEEVDIGTVVGSCLRIKGLATSIDLHILRYEVRMIARKQMKWIENTAKLLNLVAMGPALYAGLADAPSKSKSPEPRSPQPHGRSKAKAARPWARAASPRDRPPLRASAGRVARAEQPPGGN